MYVSDDEAIRRAEQRFCGDSDGRFEFPWSDARARTQALFVALAVVFVGAGYQLVYAATGPVPLPLTARAGAALLFGAAPALVAAFLVTRAYARYDKPTTRIDYYVETAVAVAAAPRPPGPPVTYDTIRPNPAADRSAREWTTTTPESLTDEWTREH